MYSQFTREKSFPSTPLGRPDQYSVTDAKSVAALFASGARPAHQHRVTRATLPDIDESNVVIIRRRTFLDRMKAAYLAFIADHERAPTSDNAILGAANIVPFRRLA